MGTAIGAPIARYALSEWDNMTPYYIGLGVSVGAWIYSVVDAKKAARRANRKNGLVLNENIQLSPTYLATKHDKSGYGISFKITF